MKIVVSLKTAALILLACAGQSTFAWDYEGHRTVNQLALASLPTNFPAFALTPQARDRIAFLSGEADRWRNYTNDLSLSHCSGPDHYLDMEELHDYGLKADNLPPFRYEMTALMALTRAENPENFAPIDPAKNADKTRELVGFAPWAIVEHCGKLRSGFSYLKAFNEYGGTAEEIANAEANIIYIMGVMGHFVGDMAQPLHATKHHHGWVGANPNNYSTNRSFHSWIDGGFYRKDGGIRLADLTPRIRDAKIAADFLKPNDTFRQVMKYIEGTQLLVEPLYKLEKERKLSPGNGDSTEGRAFLDTQLIRGGQMLGDLWFSCWQQATEDRYLIGELKRRQTPKGETK
jgi:hypothetical protein